jgi:hypothetical protein
MSAGFIKIPEPITEPTIMETVVNSPSVGINAWSEVGSLPADVGEDWSCFAIRYS